MNQLFSDRLLLRRFELKDARTIQLLAGDWDVAKMTANIPHPYKDGIAESWIHYGYAASEQGSLFPFGIVRKLDDFLMGCVSLRVDKEINSGEVAYWLGRSVWNKGYATEAVRRVIKFGFEDLKLERVWGACIVENLRSQRVLQKAGLKFAETTTKYLEMRNITQDLSIYEASSKDYQDFEYKLEKRIFKG